MYRGLFYFGALLLVVSLAIGAYFLWEKYGMLELVAKSREGLNTSGGSFFSQASDAVKNLLSSSFGGNDNFKSVKQIPLENQEFARATSKSSNSREEIGAQKSSQSQGAKSDIPACVFNTTKTPSHRDVIFSEVAWMGTTDSANNEWIEFKNISDRAVDISGWQLLDKDEQINAVFATGMKIFPGNFFILKRNEEAVPGIKANYLYSGNLRNSDEGLRLFDQNCNLVDEVIAEKSWPAGDNESKKTMERNFADLSWHTSDSTGGTPKKENSAPPCVESLNVNSNVVASAVATSTTALSAASSSSIAILVAGQEITTTNSSVGTIATSTTPVICLQENLNWPIKSVLINEVAWAGSSPLNGYGSTDEWIELKNATGESINLKGWQLINKSTNIKIFFDEKDVLASGAYYLLERTDDDSVPHISADKFFTNAILNSNESLRLFDQNCQLIDEISANPDWPAGNSYDHRTAERAANLSWQSYYGNGENGILGTPKKTNSISISDGGSTISLPIETSTSTQTSTPSRIVVNEVMAGIDGNANYEFIEFYNPATSAVDLTGWFVKKRNSAGTESSLVVSSRLEGKTILPNKYFLIANEAGYTGSVSPDIVWPSSYTLAYTNNAVILYNSQNEIIDEVSWTEIPKSQSWERTSFESSQFQVQPNPTPQNSQGN